MYIDPNDLPTMGSELDLTNLHTFYPFINYHPIEEPSICPFEGDTDPLTEVIEYMETDVRLCPVTSVIKPSDVIAGIW